MSWLLPSPGSVFGIRGKVRTVVNDWDASRDAKRESKNRRQKRWYYSSKGKAWRAKYRAKRRAWEQANADKLYANHRRWREENRIRFNLYQRLYYQTNEKRREYLRQKCREYRLKKKLEKLSTEKHANPLAN